MSEEISREEIAALLARESEEMTRERAIGVITLHREHWQRLMKGNVCSKQEGEESIAAFDVALAALSAEPCKDAVSRGVFEQVMWERDVAIEQLKELGYGFGEKLKTGHWIIISPTDMYCSECNEIEHLDTSRRFCAYCGTRMVGSQESEEV